MELGMIGWMTGLRFMWMDFLSSLETILRTFVNTNSILSNLRFLAKIGCWHPEIEPLIVTMSVDVILQEQIVVLAILLFEYAMQITALIIALELEHAFLSVLIDQLPILLLFKRIRTVCFLKWFKHVVLDNCFDVFDINGHVIFPSEDLIVPIVHTSELVIARKLRNLG